MKKTIYILTLLFTLTVIYSFTLKEEHSYKIGVLKYKGGGDWYANPTALPNLAKYCNKNLGMNINPEVAEVDVSSVEIFNYPFIHMTGHGNVVFSSSDIENLRVYLLSGGFLHIDDNYGMDKFVRAELKKIFPNKELVEINVRPTVFFPKKTGINYITVRGFKMAHAATQWLHQQQNNKV